MFAGLRKKVGTWLKGRSEKRLEKLSQQIPISQKSREKSRSGGAANF